MIISLPRQGVGRVINVDNLESDGLATSAQSNSEQATIISQATSTVFVDNHCTVKVMY
jgi:transcriptional regulator of nitric oxide reductase